jgi:hypothetical protein
MIPLMAEVRVDAFKQLPKSNRSQQPRPRLRLWIPLFLVWLLLLPLMLLLFPVLIVVSVAFGINPLRALTALWGLFTGLAGTNIELNDRKAAVRIRIL